MDKTLLRKLLSIWPLRNGYGWIHLNRGYHVSASSIWKTSLNQCLRKNPQCELFFWLSSSWNVSCQDYISLLTNRNNANKQKRKHDKNNSCKAPNLPLLPPWHRQARQRCRQWLFHQLPMPPAWKYLKIHSAVRSWMHMYTCSETSSTNNMHDHPWKQRIKVYKYLSEHSN